MKSPMLPHFIEVFLVNEGAFASGGMSWQAGWDGLNLTDRLVSYCKLICHFF